MWIHQADNSQGAQTEDYSWRALICLTIVDHSDIKQRISLWFSRPLCHFFRDLTQDSLWVCLYRRNREMVDSSRYKHKDVQIFFSLCSVRFDDNLRDMTVVGGGLWGLLVCVCVCVLAVYVGSHRSDRAGNWLPSPVEPGLCVGRGGQEQREALHPEVGSSYPH